MPKIKKNKSLYKEYLCSEIYSTGARKSFHEQKRKRKKVHVYFCDDGEQVLLASHGGDENNNYKSTGLPVAEPETLIYYTDYYTQLGYKVLICTCHPTNVGNKIPKLAEFIIGYGIVDCVVWREYYDNSIEIYVERKDL